MTDRPTILLIGDWRAAEMAPVTAALGEIAPHAEVRREETAFAARERFERSEWLPELVVVCQRWPDEFARPEIETLLRQFPLARWVVCCGAWCESDGRTRDLWPPAVRVPVRNCETRLRGEWEVLNDRRAPLPLTAGRDEAFLFDYDGGNPPPADPPDVHVAVITADGELRRFLRDWLVAWGCRVVPEPADATVVLWDADPPGERSLATLRRVCQSHREAAVIALAAFAHPEDRVRLLEVGASAVVAKLALSTELPALLP